ncbi:MAG: DUF4962 domain-containing protein [Planctomycetota bacterium]|jgi:hypothetical protein
MLIQTAMIAATVLCQDGLLPLDGRWEYPHYLTFRPGHGQVSHVNPPRTSWPYLPQVIPHDGSPPLCQFTLQLSRSGDFGDPEIEILTPYNFYNALPVLETAAWHWRVGYGVGTKEEQWSVVRRFSFSEDATAWDRTVINLAAARLAQRPHPRLGPPDGDWVRWRKQLQGREPTATWLGQLLQTAERATKRSWWNDFPKSDKEGETQLNEQQCARIGQEVAAATLAYRLTGDERFAAAKEHALALARFPKGGLASPEYHGAPRKWPTQITEFLALSYDWWYDDLTDQQRIVLLESLRWRLHATYLEKHSWRAANAISRSGPALFCQSHPFENFVWSLPGVLLTAGDLELSDELTPLVLNYLTGVTSAHGPDEAWNEGLAYGGWKGASMLRASLYTALLLPELDLGRSPYYRRLGTWYRHLLPLGVSRLSFGDYAADPEGKRGGQRNIFRFLAWLTGEGRFTHRLEALEGEVGRGPSGRPWLDLFCAQAFDFPNADSDEPTSCVFPEAGWVMESTRPPSDREAFGDAVGMIFQCRPRGGFSHSYRAENDFVWHAYGQTLSAGGGGTAYPDSHSRHSLSHNVILINGRGQEWNPRTPLYPFVGRLLAYHKDEKATHWVGDATHAYQNVPELLRWHRHVVFVDGKWFVIFDDLAVRPDADPARFSWLFHVAPDVPLTISKEEASFTYTMDDVTATVAFAGAPESLDMENRTRRKGFENPLTGEDLFPSTVAALERSGRDLSESQWMAHNVWVTNREPARQWTFLTVLAAHRQGDPQPVVTFPNRRVAHIAVPGGAQRTVSFDPDTPADVAIDVEAVRAHALATDPASLPPDGPLETVTLDGDVYRVEWLAKEDFSGGLSRWVFEGNAEVAVRDGKLWVRNRPAGSRRVATLWFRPELPQNVMVRFRAKPVPPVEENAANVNLFLHARELDGRPVRFGRHGAYNLYHEIPNYIVTLTGGYQSGWSRARRDPGFHLLHESEVRSEVGREYAVAVTFQDGRLRYYLNGVRIHDVEDPDPLPAGRFAIRTWSTNAWWDDVEFGRLTAPRRSQ